MTLLRALVLPLAAAALAGCAASPPESHCMPRTVAELPMIENRMAALTGSPVVSVTIGGEPRTMLVDTGGASSLLDPAVAARFQIRFTRSFFRLGLDAEPVNRVARVSSVLIGPRRFSDSSFAVAPVGWTGVDGTLGANWLDDMDLEIDPEDRRVVFYERDHCGSGSVHWTHGDPVTIPMRPRISDHELTVPADLDGKRIEALVDTGTPDTVLSLEAAQRLFGIGPESPGMLPGYPRALREGKSEPSWRRRFSRLAMGGIVFDHPWVTLAQMSSGGPQLIIGMEQLRHLHLLLSPSDGRLYAAMSEAPLSTRAGLDDYLNAIEGLIDRHETDNAAARLDTLLAADPGNPTAHMLRAALYDTKGDRDHGMREVEQAIRIDPGFGGAYLVRSRLQAESGDYEHAFADADRAVRLLPKDAIALNTRCWYGAISGHLERALADCDAALVLAPKDANILDSRALVHLDAGRLDDAIRDYDAALAIDSKMASSLYGRGLAERRKGDEAAAQTDIASALKIDPAVAETFGK